ncbi:MAG: zinc ribbon domain-containing protein [Candidatus Heimdallarchaeota archaeon]|nr:zinc ribbon domain-containing protein [Candidatus Heimdallarchaeota archaeon]MCK4253436.1 zinc ribbon domain-containing protein [Candidatus Heimdallarchaeota archaeon]
MISVNTRKIIPVLLFLIIFFNNSVSLKAFDYEISSLREELTDISIDISLEEGDYHLVIDNTGYVSGEYEREDTFVSIEIFALNGDPEYVSDSRNLKAHYYWDIPITTDTFLFFTIHFVFNITASNPITVFLTDEQGFIDFEEEITNFDFREPIDAFLIIGIILGSFIFLGILAGIIEKIRKKNPKRTTHVHREEEEETTKTQKLEKISTIMYHCSQCNEDNLTASKTCQKCGTKLKKVKRDLEELEEI